MKVYEFGSQNKKRMVFFQCAVEPWWAFQRSAEMLAQHFHVCLFIADGHDEQGTDFISLEENVNEAAAWLKERKIDYVDLMYGISMGGASVIRFLATESITVDKAIIDAGITPYRYPKWICRLISFWDYITVSLSSKNLSIMKMAMPPERWTPKGEEQEEHYRKILAFEKSISSKTIYNVFWTTNNYSMPEPVSEVKTKIVYWYGEEEKRARKDDVKYTCKCYPQTVVKEFPGLAHAELVLMFSERFYQEVMRFVEEI